METIQLMTKKTFELISSIELVEKAAGDDDSYITIRGYANTTTKDRTNDVIIEEAWTKGGIKNYQKNPILLAFHDHSRPIGTATKISVDKTGLEIVGKISKAAGDVYELIKEGILKAFSVGFIVKDADYDSKADVFVIKDLELLEISVVSVPANQDSIFSLSKSFESDEEYLEFKKSFISQEEKRVGELEGKIEQSSDSVTPNEDKEFSMSPEELQKLIEDAAKKAVETAEKTAKEAKEAADKAAAEKATYIQMGESGAEKLIKDVEKRFEETNSTLMKSVEDLRGAIAEKDAEIKAALESKMKFEDKASGDKVSYAEKELAVLLAKATGKPIETTKAFGQIVTKYGAHVPSADWEDIVSTNMYDEIRRRLVVAPIFTQISMNAPLIKFPLNPEAGYSNWVTPGAFMTTASSGTAQTHVLKEFTISAHKLATKEFLGNEEEDDAIIALLPIVRDAMVRRHSKAMDKALLLGVGAGTDPIKGITKYEAATANTTLTTTSKVTAAVLQSVRRKLGVWGLNPADVLYVVSQDAYYDLLEDANFLTMDKVGNFATILSGQIGSVNGSPVIVSGEFAAKAGGTAGSIGAVAINKANFMIGNYKSLTMESDYLVEAQMRLLVATLRMGFQQVSNTDGEAVSCLRWT